MSNRINQGGLQIAPVLHQLLKSEIAPGTGVSCRAVLAGTGIDREQTGAPQPPPAGDSRGPAGENRHLAPRATRAKTMIALPTGSFCRTSAICFPRGADFGIATTHVDEEVATLAGPQLVVPVMNARYALNAANARWGSLYDALYGTDVIAEDRWR